MINWIKITDRKPPENKMFLMKIDDEHGERNIQPLKRKNNLYFMDNGMYVYFTPTHWADNNY